MLGGRPVLHRVVSTAVAFAGHAVTVVLGASAREIAPLLAGLPVSIVLNRGWEEGVGSSLRCGIASLPTGCDAALILLGDQLAVKVGDLRQLQDAWKQDDGTIAASVHGRQTGPPAIFPRAFFSEISQLHGDQGARAIIERNSHRLIRVAMPNAAVDLDTPEDLAALSERFGTSATSE